MSIFKVRSLPVASLAIYAAVAAADPGTTSSYVTDPQSTHVEDATSKGIGQVNMITCVMSALKPEALVNQGAYNAMVDESKCDPQSRSSSSNASAGAQGAVYTNAIVNSSRASNNDPMIAKIWLLESEGGQDKTIFVRTSASEAPTTGNPYGIFRLDFCGHGGSAPGCLMNGFLQGGADGIQYFQTENRNDNNTPQTQTVALKLNAVGTTSGSGSMQLSDGTTVDGFNFAYNASLFRRAASDASSDQCFSRDASDPDTGQSVWRYGLYDATTGARVVRNSGFPVEYAAGGKTYQGYLGYYGLSLPPEAANLLTSGSTVQKVDYSEGQSPTKTNFTVVTAGGKLTKYTKHTRSLHGLDQIKFTTMVGNDTTSFFAGATPNTQYEMYWDDAAGNFKVTGQMNCGNNGCQLATLDPMQTVSVTYWQNQGGVQGWSQSLGGEVFIDLHGLTSVANADSIDVVYRTQDLVYPAQLPATLFCVRDCPTSDSLATYFGSGGPSPFAGISANNWNPTPVGDVVSYHTDGTQPVLLDAAGQAVVFTDASAYQQHSQYQYGVRSGRLFGTLEAAACDSGGTTFCDYKVNSLDVYYQWETGPNSSNQFAAVKDSTGAFVAFDAPLQVTFDVPANPALYKEYAGKSIVLQYSGFGELWGIPGICVSPTTNAEVPCDGNGARYVPSFVIPFNATTGRVKDGSTEYLVKWLDREIRFASKLSSVCSTAGLALPSSVTLPTAADLQDPSDPNSSIYIGVKPTVTDAPRVIHGDVKF